MIRGAKAGDRVVKVVDGVEQSRATIYDVQRLGASGRCVLLMLVRDGGGNDFAYPAELVREKAWDERPERSA